MYLVHYFLTEYEYDYIVWMDSDAVLSKRDLYSIIQCYSSSFFIGLDILSQITMATVNAGVFICRNDRSCKAILEQMILNYEDKQRICLNPDGTLNGKWAMTCYEQGIMNIVLAKHQSVITILSIDVIYNTNAPAINTVIYHNCAGGEKRVHNMLTFIQTYGLYVNTDRAPNKQ
jgi:hypothetical protein